MAALAGIEPAHVRFRAGCSATELQGLASHERDKSLLAAHPVIDLRHQSHPAEPLQVGLDALSERHPPGFVAVLDRIRLRSVPLERMVRPSPQHRIGQQRVPRGSAHVDDTVVMEGCVELGSVCRLGFAFLSPDDGGFGGEGFDFDLEVGQLRVVGDLRHHDGPL